MARIKASAGDQKVQPALLFHRRNYSGRKRPKMTFLCRQQNRQKTAGRLPNLKNHARLSLMSGGSFAHISRELINIYRSKNTFPESPVRTVSAVLYHGGQYVSMSKRTRLPHGGRPSQACVDHSLLRCHGAGVDVLFTCGCQSVCRLVERGPSAAPLTERIADPDSYCGCNPRRATLIRVHAGRSKRPCQGAACLLT